MNEVVWCWPLLDGGKVALDFKHAPTYEQLVMLRRILDVAIEAYRPMRIVPAAIGGVRVVQTGSPRWAEVAA